jgi:hypothetical protein
MRMPTTGTSATTGPRAGCFSRATSVSVDYAPRTRPKAIAKVLNGIRVRGDHVGFMAPASNIRGVGALDGGRKPTNPDLAIRPFRIVGMGRPS